MFFLHIQKTAGTSFEKILADQFPQDRICPAYHVGELAKMPEEELARYDVFRGHFIFQQALAVPSKPDVVVFLRDPVDRAVSHLRHARDHDNGGWLHKRIPEIKNMSLDDLAKHPETQRIVSNYQLRRLSVDVDFASFQGPFILNPPQQLNDDHLQLALQRLRSCKVVGLTEQFDASVKKVGDYFGWDTAIDTPALNTAQKRQTSHNDTPSEKTLNHLRSLNQLDFSLYEEACAIFQTSI